MSDDGQLNALLVRYIADLELALRHVRTSTDRDLWIECAALVDKQITGDGWLKILEPKDNNVTFTHRSWARPGEGKEQWDAQIYIDELAEEDMEDETWLAEFLGAGPNGAKVALFFEQNVLTFGSWKKLVRSRVGSLTALIDAGFSCPGDGTIFIPLTLDSNGLAQAFCEGDFSVALAPLSLALSRVVRAQSCLDDLVVSAREASR